VSAEKERNVPSSRAQKAVIRFDQGNLVGRKAERFVAYDKITLAVQIPPQVFVLRTERVRRDFHTPRWSVFAAAEIKLARRIDGINLPHREVHGRAMHLVFRVENPSYVLCRILPREKLHAATIANEATSVYCLKALMARKDQQLLATRPQELSFRGTLRAEESAFRLIKPKADSSLRSE